MVRRDGATASILLLLCSLHAADEPSQEKAKLPPIPVFTRAEMVADLNHLTAHLKRAWAHAEDKRTFLGVDIDALHGTAVRQLDEVHDADGFYWAPSRVAGKLSWWVGEESVNSLISFGTTVSASGTTRGWKATLSVRAEALARRNWTGYARPWRFTPTGVGSGWRVKFASGGNGARSKAD
jgi:hypothetical protein